MNYRRLLFITISLITACAFIPLKKKKAPEEIHEAKVELGRQLFFDKALSNPDGQSCTVCHAPKTSFSDPNHAVVSEGMVDGAFVIRNSQTLAYSSFVPPLSKNENGEYHGGLFWDGRSNSLEHQLSGPFFNPAEMNNKDTAMLVNELKKAPYYYMYKDLFGKAKNNTTAYQNMCDAIAAFERSNILNEFSSKFDLVQQGKANFSEQEARGLELFKGKANCVACHSMQSNEMGRILFTDFGYYNIGVPRNEENPFYTTFPEINPKGKQAIDKGLGDVVHDPNQDGKFRVPTLRNVQYTGPYFHNGYFKTLKEVVHFKNTRNADENLVPEIPQNVMRQRIGSLLLTDDEENDIVAFLLTLTDGYDGE
jgi:cytochrome c peroxidase